MLLVAPCELDAMRARAAEAGECEAGPADGRGGADRARPRAVRQLPLGFGLANRIVLAVGLTGLLAIAVLTSFMYDGSRELLLQRDEERLARSLGTAVSRFNSAIDFYRSDTLLLARTPPVAGIYRARSGGGVDPLDGSTERLWRDRLATIFTALIEARPQYMQVRYIGIGDGGRELVRVDRALDGRIRRIPESELQDKGDRPYFIEASRLNGGEVYVSRIELNQEFGLIEVPHRPVLRVATPVISAAGARLGLIVINVEMERTLDAMQQGFPKPVLQYVANGDGDFIEHPQSWKTFGFDLGRRYLMQEEFPALAGVVRGGGEEFSGIIESPSGRFLAVASRVHIDPLDPSRYIVVAELLPASGLAANMAAVRDKALAVSGSVLLLGLLLTIWLVRRIAKPLEDISSMAEGVARGKRRIDIGRLGERNDEVGMLARSFETMVRKVGERERALKRSEARALRSNEELAKFAYVASHDLQEPLRMVDSYMGLIERRYRGRLDAEADEFISYAVDGARRMKRLINDLLDYSRLGNRPLEVAAVDLQAVVAEIVRLFGDKLAECGGEISVGALPVLPADRVQMERLFTNLLGNAVKFRGERPLRIRVAAARKGGIWEFAVSDNGIGIEAEFREKVFEIFSRLHSRERFEGTGIGLAGCKRIIELHGGRIWAEASPEGGSTFRFTLPVRQNGGLAP